MTIAKSVIQNVNNLTTSGPFFDCDVQNVGGIGMTICNMGTFGTPGGWGDSLYPNCEFPLHSGINYFISGGLWIGGIKGSDTLVSTAYPTVANLRYLLSELNPDPGPGGAIIRRSSLRSSPYYDPKAVSEQDIICNYTDTVTKSSITGIDDFDNRNHIPLGVSIRQSSYAWSYEYAQNFVLINYLIKNLDTLLIKNMYVGLMVDGGVAYKTEAQTGWQDDLTGFLQAFDRGQGYCHNIDTINTMWFADNDGDPKSTGQWDFKSARGVVGFRILDRPKSAPDLNYNWWRNDLTSHDWDFGPRRLTFFRQFAYGLGTPTGDNNRYYILSQPSVDYDQMLTAISHLDEGFLPPPKASIAASIARGSLVNGLLSFGPIDLMPGDSRTFTMAVIIGDNFHVRPTDFANFFNPYNPSLYYGKLDFSNLADNARWADWVFDNPGWDTDGDGNSGPFVWRCNCDDAISCHEGTPKPPTGLTGCCEKEYFAGDGVPDFRPAAPPPPPTLRIISSYGKIAIRWNGKETEDALDFLSREPGFEGYRVYFSETERLTDFVLLRSYDLDDFKVFQFDENAREWSGISLSITRDSLKLLFGPDFIPEDHADEYRAYHTPDGKYRFFLPQDWNQSDLSNPHGIHRVYPNASKNDPADITDEGYMRYYEYEYVIDNLEPSKPYYFSVTAFNRGSFNKSLGVLESSPLMNAVKAYPMPSSDSVEEKGMKVTVYPNPYRIDGGYARVGYENRDRSRSADWSRLIHFANLPAVCTIRIFTPTGDLVQTINHNYPGGGPTSQHEAWNVISKNTQEVVTGIYIWVVSSAMGEQIGKLVIIK